jgi:hypothetical protein
VYRGQKKGWLDIKSNLEYYDEWLGLLSPKHLFGYIDCFACRPL